MVDSLGIQPALPERYSGFFSGLDWLGTAVIAIDEQSLVIYLNSAAEHLFRQSQSKCLGHPLTQIWPSAVQLMSGIDQALSQQMGFIDHEIPLDLLGTRFIPLSCAGTPIPKPWGGVLLELRPLSQQKKIAREEKILELQQANQDMLRNLAHEIRNPLGGIHGAAQLLEAELGDSPLLEYTEVIRFEAQRLQSLLARLLGAHARPKQEWVNIHELLERVRSLVVAEFGAGLVFERDFDTSIPETWLDAEQVTQALLNIIRNGAQALQGSGRMFLITRIARQVTIAQKYFPLGLTVSIEDNGPGIPLGIQSRIFQPLVSGRADGSGLGLMLSQQFIRQNQGLVEFESESGRTRFVITLPIIKEI